MSAVAFAEPEVISPLKRVMMNITAMGVVVVPSRASGFEIALMIGSMIAPMVKMH